MYTMIEWARKAASGSYSPYSKFRVGAVVKCGDRLFNGANIENASYGLTVCAERVAIFSAISNGYTKIDEIAVSCVDAPKDAEKNSLMPCGACRQVMAEFSSPETIIHIDGVGQVTLSDILPKPFVLKCESVE